MPTKEQLAAQLMERGDQLAEAKNEIKRLKGVVTRQAKKIDAERDKRADTREAMRKAIEENISLLEIAPVKPPPKQKRPSKATPEFAIPLVSDLQLAKQTQGYNTEVCEERMEEYAEKIAAITRVQRTDHPVDDCHVLNLGDIVEGELIFPGQSHEIDASLYRQVTVDGPRIMGNFLRRLLAEFQTVKVWSVIGNHGAIGGRSRREMNPESNADRMLYTILEMMFQDEPRIEFITPQRDWYLIADLGANLRFLMFHGDQIRGSLGMPWYGYGKKILGWKALAANGLMADFDHAVSGHWHTPTSMYINDVRVWVNGTTESHNAYAQENLASMGRPSQRLLFGRPDIGVTAEYLVNLEGKNPIGPAVPR